MTTPDTDDDFTNLIAEYQGTYAYSYTFDGQAGYLDHALANGPLAAQVTGAADWHINSDEPDILDYDTTFKPAAQDALYEPNQYRTSDHDPVIVGLDLINATPTFEAVVAASCSNGAGGTYSVTVDDYDLLEAELTLAADGQHEHDARSQRERRRERGRRQPLHRDHRREQPEGDCGPDVHPQ